MTIIPLIRRNYLCFNSCDMYLNMIMMIFDLDVKIYMKKMKILINLVFKNTWEEYVSEKKRKQINILKLLSISNWFFIAVLYKSNQDPLSQKLVKLWLNPTYREFCMVLRLRSKKGFVINKYWLPSNKSSCWPALH